MVCISVLIDFNSIKVRLEPRTFHLASKRPAYFNSIKVQLERKHLRDTHYHENFNSIKVRLELMAIGLGAALELFQFHKGAIRTNVIGVAAMRLYEFQFHKGAIRTSA